MPPTADLELQAHRFAQQIGDLLNRTVTHGVSVTSVLSDGHCFVGYRISRRDHLGLTPIPLTISAADPSAYLLVRHEFRLDPEGVWLTDARSAFGVYADADLRHLLARWDYNRDIRLHASAHVHVGGESPAVELLARRDGVKRELSRHHFPVGGKRFRPCLEDIVQYIVEENIASARPGWRAALEEHRDLYYEIQLKAAVRRNPAIAADALKDAGWDVTNPQ